VHAIAHKVAVIPIPKGCDQLRTVQPFLRKGIYDHASVAIPAMRGVGKRWERKEALQRGGVGGEVGLAIQVQEGMGVGESGRL
jgi:hypothetical protein